MKMSEVKKMDVGDRVRYFDKESGHEAIEGMVFRKWRANSKESRLAGMIIQWDDVREYPDTIYFSDDDDSELFVTHLTLITRSE